MSFLHRRSSTPLMLVLAAALTIGCAPENKPTVSGGVSNTTAAPSAEPAESESGTAKQTKLFVQFPEGCNKPELNRKIQVDYTLPVTEISLSEFQESYLNKIFLKSQVLDNFFDSHVIEFEAKLYKWTLGGKVAIRKITVFEAT